MLMKRLSGIIGALLLAGCVNLEDPAPSQATRLVIHGILSTQALEQTVLVYRARTGLPTGVEGASVSEDEPVSDAQLSITTPDGTTVHDWRLATPSGECCVPGTYVFPDSLSGPSLVRGGTYVVRIRTALGEEVTGATTVPGPADVTVQPAHLFLRLRDTLRLSWPRVPGAASYEVVIRMAQFGNEYRAFADTSFTLAGTALTITGDEIFARGQDADIVVSAVDANYYDYYRSQSDPFAGAAPSHLTGAVGIFGSIMPFFATRLLVR